MYRGTVTCYSRIPNLIFEQFFEVDPDFPAVETIKFESAPGFVVRATAHVTNVTSHNDGIRAAEAAVEKALNRLSYSLGAPVADRYFKIATFESMDGLGDPVTIHPPAGAEATQVVSLLGNDIVSKVKAAIEKPAIVGERHFGLFRSAVKAENAVERFLHLYHILLFFNNDKQSDVDAFILSQEPKVTQTPIPNKNGKKETIYTRLRNEFAHQRPGVNVENTKREMEMHSSSLMHVVKLAIKMNP